MSLVQRPSLFALNVASYRIGALVLAGACAACGASASAGGGADGGQAEGDSGILAADAGPGTSNGNNPGLDSGERADSAETFDAGVAADAGSDVDNGAPSSTYPAFKVDVAQIVDGGGPVLAAPVIVTVTWSADTQAATWNALGDAIGSSTYWQTINSEYGVGPASSGSANHVSIATAPPVQISDNDLDTLVSDHAGVDWPAPTANTIYAVYLAPQTTLYFGGLPDAGGQDVCAQGVGGYHSTTNSHGIVYAIMPQCPMFKAGDIELSATHELNEASTDPQGSAWVGYDKNHLAFEFFNQFQDELGDACELFVEATDSVDFPPYTAQRQWSNKSAAAGSHWCLPALGEPFYNTTFLLGEPAGTPSTQLDDISVDVSALGGGKVSTKGFKVALNTSRTFPIGYFSDSDTSGPFTLDVQWPMMNVLAQDQNGNSIMDGTATVTIDKTSGVNGNIAYVTVTPTAFSSFGVVFFYVRSVLPNSKQHHYLPVLISQN
jgi:hypothetical protein